MKDIQSASSVSGSCSKEALSSVVSLQECPLTVSNMPFLLYLLEYNCQAFPGTQKGIFLKLFPRDISCEFVKGVFPVSFLLCNPYTCKWL